MKEKNNENRKLPDREIGVCTKNQTPRETIETALSQLVSTAEELSRYVSGLRDVSLAPPLAPPEKGRSSFEAFLKQDIVVWVDLATATLNEAFMNLQAVIEEG